jgi:arsenate reductase
VCATRATQNRKVKLSRVAGADGHPAKNRRSASAGLALPHRVRLFTKLDDLGMASIIIWHNPKCGTSRNSLALLQERGHAITIVEYLKTPPDAATLARVAAAVGGAKALLRTRGTDAEERGLPNADDATILAAMQADPILINRPVVIGPKGIVLARPAEMALETA